jgi:Na+-transporting methylmalonyl-CoA/oxaloacetate decarboxylase gamma subunit
MTIEWPVALIVLMILVCSTAIVSEWIKNRSKAEFLERFRTLASDYETLAKESRDLQAVIQSDLAALRKQVDSIEHMIREVG